MSVLILLLYKQIEYNVSKVLVAEVYFYHMNAQTLVNDKKEV